MMAEAKFFMGYSRWNDSTSKFETWEEAVDRVMDMHTEKYKSKLTFELSELMGFATQAYKNKQILGAQRALQFGGEQLKAKNARAYNCSTSYCDRPAFFNEAMYLLLCGAGVGFSVQSQHIEMLPSISSRSKKKVKVFQVPDSIEGWADSFAVLLSTYFCTDQVFPEYHGYQVHFDFSKIRAKGSMISGGFKAPGSDALRTALIKCEEILERELSAGVNRLRSIVAYDFVMHMSDAVLSGGVRRSATIAMFSKNDNDMLTAKTGDWFVHNPQRGRSNNSVMLKRGEVTRQDFADIMKSVKQVGEPGFIWTDDLEFLSNPCVEIGMLPRTDDGVSGWQVCNLCEINGSMCNTEQEFFDACKAAAVLGTLQAGYTDFGYLSEASKKITEREALLGVGITGWMNNAEVLFSIDTMRKGAIIINETNKRVAEIIGIKQAARTTCVKPSGNASVILGTASGIHGEHSPLYFRNVQMNEQDEVLQIIQNYNPQMVEKSVWSSSGTDYVVSFPVVSKIGSVYKSELMGVKQLEYVKLAQQNWVEAGTNIDLCVHPKIRHNVSNTITVDDWDEVEQYIYDNQESFAGISLLSAMGDKGYPQAPFTEVFTAQQIFNRYGEGSMFASGVIVDALHAFNNNLWAACDNSLGYGEELTEDSVHLLKRDWVRRAKKYADNYFESDVMKMTFCLKDCFNLHKWLTLQSSIKNIDFSTQLSKKTFTEVDTLQGQACAGGTCEIDF